MARHARVLLRHRDRQGRGPRAVPGDGSGSPRAAHPRHRPRARRRPQHRRRDPTPRTGGEYRVVRRAAARRSSAAESRARGQRSGRTGRRRLRRSVPTQQLLFGGTQRPTVAASLRASSLERSQARCAHGRPHPPPRRHDRRRALLRADTPRAVRADPPARALAAATATPTATPAETALSDASRGLTAVDGIMNKALAADIGNFRASIFII